MLDILTLAILVGLVFGCAEEKKAGIADLALTNGKIWTVDPGQPWAEAVAIKKERIIKVGTTEEIKNLLDEKTQEFDLKGSFVLPGFIDSHTHFLDGGFALSSIQLREAKSKEAFIEIVEERTKEIDKGVWILNGDWDQQQFDPPEMPRREWIDAVSPENPVFVNRLDGHMALANSLALEIAGITKDTISPPGGEILKDPETGEPTGILKDEAMSLVSDKIPEPSLEEKKKAARAALRHASRMGVTSVHDMAYSSNFDVYHELLREGTLSARVTVYFAIGQNDLYAELERKKPLETDLLKIGGLKGFVDGSLGSFTALFFESYSDDPTKTGILASDMYPEGIMEERIRKADAAGLQVAVHAIGDRANHIILDIMERVIAEGGPRDRRWRIEHAQHLIPEDFTRFAEMDIIASMQPYHAIDDGRWAERKIGKERAKYTYAFKTFLDADVLLALGSDWTVAPLDPISGIYAAVTRRTLDGKNPDGWFPEQKISLEEAIKGYTMNGAYTEFAEDEKGSIRAGKLADLVVLSQNLFEIPPEDIGVTEVLATICNGEIIYKK
ncbi:MAG: amidohydrolase [Candidatus Aminicenantes bacterium]